MSDFVEGESLRQVLNNRQLHFKEAAEICAGVAEALHRGHEVGVIHRDLKPANIIIDRNGIPYVTDFGLAKWTRQAQEAAIHGTLLATPAYISPEQAGGNGSDADCATDVYSLGVILFEMLAGRRPFVGEPAAVIQQILYCEPPLPRRINKLVPRHLESVCLKALHKNPAQRYLTARDFAVDLRRFIRGEPVLARRARRIFLTLNWFRRRPFV